MSENAATAAEPDKAQENPGAASEGEPDDLDRLLNEWKADHPEQQTDDTTKTDDKPPAKAPDSQSTPFDPQRFERVERMANAWEAEQLQKSVQGVVKGIKSENESLADLDDIWIEGRLHAEAIRDPRVDSAFQQRDNNPEAWAKIQASLGKKIAKEADKRSDTQLSQDREAAQASVRNRSNQPPPDSAVKNDDLVKMSDSEFFDKYPTGGH